ncbi:hypothetical protein ACU686_44460 [Yinghuangia aomiensis]
MFPAADQTAALSAVPDQADFVGVVLAPGADPRRRAPRARRHRARRRPAVRRPGTQPELQVLSGGSLGRLEGARGHRHAGRHHRRGRHLRRLRRDHPRSSWWPARSGSR